MGFCRITEGSVIGLVIAGVSIRRQHGEIDLTLGCVGQHPPGRQIGLPRQDGLAGAAWPWPDDAFI